MTPIISLIRSLVATAAAFSLSYSVLVVAFWALLRVYIKELAA